MSRAGASQVKKEDRLFSLILALVSSREGLTKSDILQTVRGYSDVYDFNVNSALDKMFERDKSELRSMGVVIDTLELAEEEGETHNIRYSISRNNYDLPDTIRFTPEELTLLNVAATAWQEASLSADSRHALTKIKSLGISANDPLIGVAPHIRTDDVAFEVIEDALQNELILRFSYLKPGQSQPQTRTAAPLAMLNWRGQWYVLAHDLDADAQRTFLLRRIVSAPQRIPQRTFPRIPASYAQQLEQELVERSLANKATITVISGSDAEVRLSSLLDVSISGTKLTFGYSDLELLAEELASYGDEVNIASPEELKVAVQRRFQAVLLAHSESGL
ncbi:proteasome accessory factor B [Aurantimicrobium minutum]|uniref:helix-turn-helix transcriptional regulator n=1 Tax=Aurantimicrobium minutum TaxID=708131 RepID=UPI0024734014|nr:WYL domain-containing protein [Aurantimicrobium minutum]MDH6532919.1 proteasome accessory factor B [Aurantimicrobium minutum]